MVAERNGAIEEIQKVAREVDLQIGSLQAELEDEKSGIIDIVRRTAQLHNEIQSLSSYRDNLANQKQRLAGRAQTVRAELERLLTEKAQHNARLGDIERVLVELDQNLESKRQKSEETEGQIAEERKRLAGSKETRSALEQRAVRADRHGAAVRRSGQRGQEHPPGPEGREQEARLPRRDSAQKIGTDVEHAGAVEAALEGLTDVLLVNDMGRLLQDGEMLANLEGRVHFRRLDQVEPFVDDVDFSKYPFVRGRLVEFIRCESRYSPLAWSLLGKTIVVDSLDAVMGLTEHTRAGYTFVTLGGACLSADGLLRLGPLGQGDGPDLPPQPDPPTGRDDRDHQRRDRGVGDPDR